jgi:hypothetical protein
MRRTMQTAMLSLDWLIERGVKFDADADWQGQLGQLKRSYHPHHSI